MSSTEFSQGAGGVGCQEVVDSKITVHLERPRRDPSCQPSRVERLERAFGSIGRNDHAEQQLPESVV
jgi:hypothetical protein